MDLSRHGETVVIVGRSNCHDRKIRSDIGAHSLLTVMPPMLTSITLRFWSG